MDNNKQQDFSHDISQIVNGQKISPIFTKVDRNSNAPQNLTVVKNDSSE